MLRDFEGICRKPLQGIRLISVFRNGHEFRSGKVQGCCASDACYISALGFQLEQRIAHLQTLKLSKVVFRVLGDWVR